MEKSARHYLIRHIDRPLLTLVGLVLAIGLLTLHSASGGDVNRTIAQSANIFIALVLMWIVANVPLHYLSRIALPVYMLGLILLIAVEFFGEVVNGAQRWLDLGFTRLQPSELMKIAVPLMMAWYFDRYESVLRGSNFLVGVILLFVPVFLIVNQPDLGTAILVAVAGVYVLFLAGLSFKVFLISLLIVLGSVPFIWSNLHGYQQQRILTLFDPSQDPLGSGYHIIQSSIALGSGGLLGKGWLNGTQSQLDFLPERTTDFVFAVYAEEFGLLGNLLLLFLFLAIIGRGLIIAANAPTLFTRLLAGAISLIFFTYVFVNIGMVSGILPVVGVPLPLISYGGTSLVTILFGIGILMSIQTHRRLVQT